MCRSTGPGLGAHEDGRNESVDVVTEAYSALTPTSSFLELHPRFHLGQWESGRGTQPIPRNGKFSEKKKNNYSSVPLITDGVVPS